MAPSETGRRHGASPSPAPAAPPRLQAILPWLDPLQAWRALRASGEATALLDGVGAHPEARHAVVTAGWARELRIVEGAVEEHHPSGAIEVLDEGPLEALRAAFASTTFLPGSAGPAFTGGWLVALGLGFAQALEPSLPRRADDDWPQAVLRLVPDVVAFDRATRTCVLHVTALDGDVEAAAHRLGRLATLLQNAASVPEAPVQAPRPSGAQQAAGLAAGADERSFCAMVAAARELIHDGDLFQVNLATRWDAPADGDLADLFEALRRTNPSPYMALVPLGGCTIVSGSPEQLFATGHGRIRARPIAGTRGRGADGARDEANEAELRADPKEQAEHLMLVDLVRNDLARVCEPGSVHVPELMAVERYRHVMHLASRVEGTLRPGTTAVDWIAALFPGGTVTGAPKVRATQRILELEPAPRGYYTGSVGTVSWTGDAHLNILIRGLVERAGTWHVHAGSGIVADSRPEHEWKEAGRKARAMLDAATGQAPATPAVRLGEVAPAPSWSPPAAPARAGPAPRVLVIDSYDSFVHNLADLLQRLGAHVRVERNDADWQAAVSAFAPTHILLSPGPGWPAQAGRMPELVRSLAGRLPMLGVCLGHQALGEFAGARVTRHPAGPVHGKAEPVMHDGQGLFASLPSPLPAMRYHSLVVGEPPGPWRVDARLDDGTVMALRHDTLRLWGLQFHPESVGTPAGARILANWLEAAGATPAVAAPSGGTEPRATPPVAPAVAGHPGTAF